jgi:hypothetical protein
MHDLRTPGLHHPLGDFQELVEHSLNWLQRCESGPYSTAFSLRIPDMSVEAVKICLRAPNVLLSTT